MNGWIIAGMCLAPSATIAALLTAAAIHEGARDRDAQRRIVALTEREQMLRMETPAEARIRVRADGLRDDLDRFAELCAWFQPQAEEIQSLPVVEPYWRHLPNGWQR